jgi:hypothetical protein
VGSGTSVLNLLAICTSIANHDGILKKITTMTEEILRPHCLSLAPNDKHVTEAELRVFMMNFTKVHGSPRHDYAPRIRSSVNPVKEYVGISTLLRFSAQQ